MDYHCLSPTPINFHLLVNWQGLCESDPIPFASALVQRLGSELLSTSIYSNPFPCQFCCIFDQKQNVHTSMLHCLLYVPQSVPDRKIEVNIDALLCSHNGLQKHVPYRRHHSMVQQGPLLAPVVWLVQSLHFV